MKTMLERFKNVGTIITLASLVVMLLGATGVFEVDSEKVMNIVYLLCSIGTLVGIFNNPETSGIDLPGVDYPIFKQPDFSIEEETRASESLKKEKGIE